MGSIQEYNEKIIQQKKCILSDQMKDYNKSMIQTNVPVIQKITYDKTPLCELAEKYQVDKCPENYHYYTIGYYELLKDFKPKSMLEIGIGFYEMMSNYAGSNYKKGASLYMWRDFFKNCKVYGADIVQDCMFEDEGIETILCDQSKPEHLKQIINILGEQDLILDDGSHINQHQFTTFLTLWEHLREGGLYIIEDLDKTLVDPIGHSWSKVFDDCECIKMYAHDNDIQGFVCFRKNRSLR